MCRIWIVKECEFSKKMNTTNLLIKYAYKLIIFKASNNKNQP